MRDYIKFLLFLPTSMIQNTFLVQCGLHCDNNVIERKTKKKQM